MYPERFVKATDKLIKAYLNDTLFAGSCDQCAVGNLCNNNENWFYVLIYFRLDNNNYIRRTEANKGLKAMGETGYSIAELDKIESTFEQTKGSNFDKLVAVFNLLCKFDNIEDSSPFIEALKPKQLETVGE